MECQRLTVITDKVVIEELWLFYQEAFADLNEQTPVAQTWPRIGFDEWMSSERVIVIVARINNEVVGFGVVTDDLSVEPLLSPTYFKKHHTDGKVWYFPAIAVAKQHRTNFRIAQEIVERLMGEIPEDAEACYMFFSTEQNSVLPRLITRFCQGRVAAEVVGSESCLRLTWTDK